MKIVAVALTLIFALDAVSAQKCNSNCPLLSDPICLHIQNGKTIKKSVDVANDCKLKDYVCLNNVGKFLVSEGKCSEQNPPSEYVSCSFPKCVKNTTYKCLLVLEEDGTPTTAMYFLKDSCAVQTFACKHGMKNFKAIECPDQSQYKRPYNPEA